MPDITISASDNTGSFSAYVSKPKTGSKWPGLVLIQEIFGVNGFMRAMADAYAEQGFYCVVPDLFWRQQPGVQLTDKTKEEWDKAIALMNGFNIDKGVEDLAATMAWLRSQPECTGKVGDVGFCLGGRLAVLMSTRTDIDASVSYYGVFLDNLVGEFKNIHKPLLMHVAGLDPYAKPEARAKYEPVLKDIAAVEYHLYPDADHAFARTGGEHYNEADAKLANDRTATFLKMHLE